MRVLLLGSDGLLGHELNGVLGCFAQVVCATRADFDLADPDALRSVVRSSAPDAIVNAAGYTDVDRAEQEPGLARRINADAVADLGALSLEMRCPLIHYSTDYVFDGAQGRAYSEDDTPRPLSTYGLTKLEGERALLAQRAPALILRSAWLFGRRGRSFLPTILRVAREREVLRVVADQVGSPTSCRDLATATGLILYAARRAPLASLAPLAGIYHLAGTGSCSRYELASAALALDPDKHAHRIQRLEPVPTSAYPLPAQRPANSSLDCAKAERVLGLRLPPWRGSLARALAG